jgi:hypothetical protein
MKENVEEIPAVKDLSFGDFVYKYLKFCVDTSGP